MEVFHELHSEYNCPIQISHSRMATLSLATLHKIQENISIMNVHLHRIIRNWDHSGHGDGGIDVDNDGDEVSSLEDNVKETVKKS
jgi:hypothetical protein